MPSSSQDPPSVSGPAPAVQLPPPRPPAPPPPVELTVSQPILHCAPPAPGPAWTLHIHESVTLSSPEQEKQTTTRAQPTSSLRRQRRVRVHPTNEPKARIVLAPPTPTSVNNGRIHFSCPACLHTISVPRQARGGKCRCPQCSSALRSPLASEHSRAHNYERSIEALLHPTRFPLLTNPNGSLRWQITAIPAIVLTLALMAGSGAWLWHHHAFPNSNQKTASTSSDPIRTAEQAAAESVVRSFLKASDWQEKSHWVRDSARVAPLMKQFYAQSPIPILTPTDIKASSLGEIAISDQVTHHICKVAVSHENAPDTTYVVEFLPEGPRIEWETSVAYCPTPWAKLFTDAPGAWPAPKLLRIAAHLDPDFLDNQVDQQNLIALALSDPLTGQSLGHGLVTRRSEDGMRLQNLLAANSASKPRRIMIEVMPISEGKTPNIVQINRFLKSGFRMPDTTGLAQQR